jgi:ribonuclease HI
VKFFFLWRACNDILPTKENLWKKKIIKDPTCLICGREVESVFHILWQCPSSMDVWSGGCLRIQKCSFTGPDFLEVMEGLLNKCTGEELEIFSCIVRRIWLRRNEVLHGGGFAHPSTLVQKAMQDVEDHRRAQEREDIKRNVRDNQPVLGWKAPEIGWVKANWDAAIGRGTGRTGLGVVIRDSHGAFLLARCGIKRGCLEPCLAEAEAVLMAIHLCRDLGLLRVVFEGDAKGVVDRINSAEVDRGWMGQVISDIKLEISALEGWRVQFVRREDNKAAHILAQMTVQHDLTHVWDRSPPACLQEVIELEQITTGN